MRGDAGDFLAEWHRIVASRDLSALREALADEVSIGAPPYWQRFAGRELVHHLLGRVGEVELQGIDLITLDARGAIAKLDVLMRPIGAIAALQEVVAPQMIAFLAQRPKR